MDYIYINENVLCNELCNDIIELFEKSNNKYEGITASGLNKKIKDTTDLIINKNNTEWKNIFNFLKEELLININAYFNKINEKYINNKDNNNKSFELINRNIEISQFMIQKYLQNTGKYIYHNDFDVDHQQKKYRVLTYIFYLNTINEGGETEIIKDIKIKPESGKLLLFPASWTYPHSGLMPISSDKYIITGWIYNFNK
jgi:hypothetical protein